MRSPGVRKYPFYVDDDDGQQCSSTQVQTFPFSARACCNRRTLCPSHQVMRLRFTLHDDPQVDSDKLQIRAGHQHEKPRPSIELIQSYLIMDSDQCSLHLPEAACTTTLILSQRDVTYRDLI